MTAESHSCAEDEWSVGGRPALAKRRDRTPGGFDNVVRFPTKYPLELLSFLLSSVLDRFPHGIFVTDHQAQPQTFNHAARVMMSSGFVQIRNGRLRGGPFGRPGALQSAIAECSLPGSPFRVVQLDGAKGGVLTALIDRLQPSQVRPDLTFAIVVLLDPTRNPEADADVLKEQYALTSTEARFAIEIMRADGLPACARRMGIRLTTARSHLKHIFDKTGTRRQAELVRLLLLSNTPFAPPG